MNLARADALGRASGADHGILSTLHLKRGIDSVPACFVIDGDVVAVPIDAVKPKASTTLQRIRNLEVDPRATLLCEQWDPDDWSRLWWVRLHLVLSDEAPETAMRCADQLQAKYRQYAGIPFTSILTFRITGVAGWAAGSEAT